MNDYKKLKIYDEAYNLTKSIYVLTQQWPPEEKYVLVPQIRRSAHSVNSNICEGVSRGSKADCLRFIYSAYASLQETENHLQLAYEMKYFDTTNYKKYKEKIDYLSRMINNFILYLKA